MRAARAAAAEPAEAPPEADRVEGAPHPRDTPQLFGHEAAEAQFLQAFETGRMHHAWMITGPRGIGKATLAWRIARFLLTAPPPGAEDGLFGAPPPATSLETDPAHPVVRRIHAMAEPGLFLLRRSWDADKSRHKQQITVDEVRRMKSFFTLSASDGGRRVAIIDAADEMNTAAANALLKLLEEPPANTVMLLIAHQPSRLLPTIRSRCRELRLAPLAATDIARALEQADSPVSNPAELAELSAGSVGEALRLLHGDGPAIYARITGLFTDLPRLDRIRALALAEAAAGRGAEQRFELTLMLLDLFLARLARTGALGHPPAVEAAPGEAALLARLAPSPEAARLWAEAAQALGARARQGRAVNLDPAALLMDMVLKVHETAARLVA